MRARNLIGNLRHEAGVQVVNAAEHLALLGGWLLNEKLHVHRDTDFAEAYAAGQVDAGVHL